MNSRSRPRKLKLCSIQTEPLRNRSAQREQRGHFQRPERPFAVGSAMAWRHAGPTVRR
jgi:hypothetical protein